MPVTRYVMGVALMLSATAATAQPLVIDDFNRGTIGAPPDRWVFYTTRGQMHPLDQHFSEREQFLVTKEGNARFLRLYTRGEAQRITLLTDGTHLRWDLAKHPRLRWRWRANRLPSGASEDRRNDVGGAVYITFGTDRLGRPKSIKYTYSSSLPPGSVLRQGSLRVVVVSRGETNRWETIVRDVAADYRSLFGEDPPDPKSITLWSDSDDTNSEAEVDVDDLVLLPPPR